MRSNLEGARVTNNILGEKNRFGMTQLASTGTAIALGADTPPLIALNLTGATNVKLPAASGNKGLMFYFVNNSTGAVTATLQTSTGGALVGVVTVAQNKVAMVICDGAKWRGGRFTST
jgi:hypothetical protein